MSFGVFVHMLFAQRSLAIWRCSTPILGENATPPFYLICAASLGRESVPSKGTPESRRFVVVFSWNLEKLKAGKHDTTEE